MLPIKHFDSAKFRHSIDELTENASYQKNTLAISEKLGAEDGIANAIRIIELVE